MKNSYKLALPWSGWSGRWVFLLALFIGSGAAQAQRTTVFTETMGTALRNGAVTEESIGQHTSSNLFDNDNEKSYVYSGTARVQKSTNAGYVASSGYPGASGGINVYAPSGSTNVQLTMSNITLSNVSSPELTFGIYNPSTTALTSTQFQVQMAYSTDGGTNYSSLTSVPYSFNVTPSQGWGQGFVATSGFPAGLISALGNATPPRLRLVLQRMSSTGAAQPLVMVDDVVLTSAVQTSLTATIDNQIFPDTPVGTTSDFNTAVVTGTGLSADVTVTAPSQYEVSLDGTTYSSSVTVPRDVDGAVDAVEVYVRFAPTSTGLKSGSLTFVSGSLSRSITIQGTATAAVPAITVTGTPLSDFGSVTVGASSTPQTIQVSGANLVGPITITAPTNFQISLNNSTYTTGTLTLAQSGGSVAATTVYVRFTPTSQGAKTGNVVLSTDNNSGGTTTQSVAVSGTGASASNTATITVNPTALAFGNVSQNGSLIKTFELNATSLKNNSTVTLTGSSTNVYLRVAGTGSFVNTGLTLSTDATGNLLSQFIEVQLIETSAGAFSGNVTVTGTRNNNTTLTAQVALTATGLTGQSAINATGVLSEFSTVPGVPSTHQTYQLSGTNLLNDIQVTAPTYFQIAKTLAELQTMGTTTTGNTITYAPNSGNDLTVQTVYVRYVPSVAQEDASQILHSSSPAGTVGLPVSGTSQPSVDLGNAFVSAQRIVIFQQSTVQTLTFSANRVRQDITISTNLPENTAANPSQTRQFQLSKDGVTFSESVTYTPDAAYSISAPLYVRYAPTYLGQASNNLRFQSSDFAITVAQNFNTNGNLSGRSIDVQPTAERPFSLSRAPMAGSTTLDRITITFGPSVTGQGEGHLVVASEGAQLANANMPVDGTSYQTNNSNYGDGPTLAPGYYSVYAGGNDVVTIDNFDRTKTYYFYVFEYNNIDPNTSIITTTAENYLTPTTPDPIEGVISNGTPLPVQLVAFAARLQNQRVVLNWATAQEKDNKGFAVERSADGRTFEQLEFVAGHGNATNRNDYVAFDNRPLSGTSYYRLRQVDNSGAVAYSPVQTVRNGATGVASVFPNPTQNRLTVQLPVAIANARVQVLDLSGRTVLSGLLGTDGQLDLSRLTRGTYLVQVQQDGQQWTQRVVKQ